MANVYAIKNGTWSDVTLWNTSALPNTNDDVYSNNFTVFVDGDYQVNSIRNVRLTSEGINAGGQFIANDGITLSAYVYGGGTNTVACLQFLSAAPAEATLMGSLCAGDPGNTVSMPVAFRNFSTGTFNIIGNFDGVFNNGGNPNFNTETNGGIINSSTGTLTLCGLYFLSSLRAAQQIVSIRNQTTGIIFLTGDLIGSDHFRTITLLNRGAAFIQGNIIGGSAGESEGLINTNTGSAFISGNIFAGPSTPGVRHSSTEVLEVIGDATGRSSAGNAINNSSTGVVYITGAVTARGIINSSSGQVYIKGPVTAINVSNVDGAVNQGSGLMFIEGNIKGANTTGGAPSRGVRNNGSGIVIAIGEIRAGEQVDNEGILNNSTGTVSAVGTVIGGVGTRSAGIRNISTGSVFVSGTVLGCLLPGGTQPGISNESSGTVYVVGQVQGTDHASGLSNTGSTGKIIVDGIAKAGPRSGCHSINNTGANAQIYVRTVEGNGFGLFSAGDVEDRAIANAFAINNTQINALVAVQNIKCGLRGNFPTTGNVVLTSFDNNFGEFFQFRQVTGQTVTFLRSQALLNYVPNIRDVREGTVYGENLFTGTLAMPDSLQVIFGVPVDDTTGTGFLSATLAWATPVSSLNTPGSLGERSKRCLTINSLSAMVLTFNT